MHFEMTDTEQRGITFTKGLSFVKRGSLDFVTDSFFETWERKEHFSLPHSLGEVKSLLNFRRPIPTTTPRYTGGAFSSKIGVALALGISALLSLAGLVMFRMSEHQETGLVGSCVQTIGLFCNQGLALQPRRPWHYVTSAVLCVVAMLCCQIYTAGFLSRITMQQIELPFAQPEDVLDTPGWKWGVIKGSASSSVVRDLSGDGINFADRSNDFTGNNFINYTELALSQMESENFAFINPELSMLKFCKRRSCPNICSHTKALFVQRYSIPFRRGEPENPAWSLAFLRMKETGIWSRLKRQQLPMADDINMRCVFTPQPRNAVLPLRLEECLPAFYMLMYGVAASLSLLVCELLMSHLKLGFRNIGLNTAVITGQEEILAVIADNVLA